MRILIETDRNGIFSHFEYVSLKIMLGYRTGSIIFSWEEDKVTLQSTSGTGINDATYGAITALNLQKSNL